jgi:hypothetical protein
LPLKINKVKGRLYNTLLNNKNKNFKGIIIIKNRQKLILVINNILNLNLFSIKKLYIYRHKMLKNVKEIGTI